MREQLRPILAAALAGSLIFAFADFVLAAQVQGVTAESYAAITRPLAVFVASALAVGLACGAAGVVLPAHFGSTSVRAAGFALAGSATVALWVVVTTPLRAFPSRPHQAILWGGVWIVLGALFAAVEAAPAGRLGGRVGRAAPALLAGVGAYQILKGLSWFPFDWLALAAGIGVAAWAFVRQAPALGVNLALAGAAFAAPLLAPPGPRLELPGVVDSFVPLDSPRVILITVDTLRADELGFAGGVVSTPNLNRLASESVVFEQARSMAPWTLPTLSSFHLGVSPLVHGARAFEDRPSSAPQSLAERFRAAGYRTAKIGYNFFLTPAGSGRTLTQGFETVAAYPKGVRPATGAFKRLVAPPRMDLDVEANTDDLVRWARQWVERYASSRFFLWLHIYDPHQPYLPPAEFSPDGAVPALDDPTTNPLLRPKSPAEADRMRALYRGEITYVDDQLGTFLARLRELGIYDDSLIVFTSDHGDEFFEHAGFGHGHTLHDELLHVPLLIKPPGGGEGRRVTGRVSTMRLAPTLLKLANVKYDPADFSAEPLALEEESEVPIFAVGSMRNEPQEAVIFDGLKLIRYPGFGGERLYDLESDPSEQVDLAAERPEDVRRGIALLDEERGRAEKLKTRLGVDGGRRLDYGPDERKKLRSLGYVQ